MKKIGFLVVLAVMAFVGYYIWSVGNQILPMPGDIAYFLPCACMVVCSICKHRFDWILALPSIGACLVISQLFFVDRPQIMAWVYLVVCTLWSMRCIFGESHDTVTDVFREESWSLNDMSGDEWD